MSEPLKVSTLLYDYARDLPPKVISRISPSQLGGCSRKHYLSIKQVQPTTPTNPGAILNMQTGFMWEKLIQSALEHAHIPFMYQYKMVDEELNMEGTLDFGILENGGKELYILDSKTESSLAKKYRKKISYFEAHEDYMHQLNAYAIMAVRQGFTVTRGGFTVIERDNSFIVDEPFMFDMSSIAKTMAKIKQMNEWLKNDILPECDGKYCRIGLCEFGRPAAMKPNTKGKLVNTTCCGTPEQIEEWRHEPLPTN